MGLHIPHPLAQLVGFLRSSGSRLVWNGLQLATIDVVKQRSEDLPCSLRPTKHTVRISIHKEAHCKGSRYAWSITNPQFIPANKVLLVSSYPVLKT